MTRESGYLVQMKDGRKGRTYSNKGMIGSKIPVYPVNDKFEPEEKGVLCNLQELTVIGFIS